MSPPRLGQNNIGRGLHILSFTTTLGTNTQMFIDAPFELDYIMEVLSLASDELGVRRRLMADYEESQFENFLRRNPRGFSWKTIAIELYKSGENESLDQLFKLVHSPEGT